MEELERAQDRELFLAIDLGRTFPQRLMNARQVGCKLEAIAIALGRILLQRLRGDDRQPAGDVSSGSATG